MKKILLFALISLFLIQGICWGVGFDTQLYNEIYTIKPELKDLITTDNLDQLIAMAKRAVCTHGLLYSGEAATATVSADSNYAYVRIGWFPIKDVVFITSVSRLRSSALDYATELGLIEIDISEIGHRSLTAYPTSGYWAQFKSGETTFIYLYPAPDTTTQLYIEYIYGYGSTPPYSTVQLIARYATFLACLSIDDYDCATLNYNEYRQTISYIRDQKLNRQPDISSERKILK